MWYCVIKQAVKDSNTTMFRVQVTLNMETLPSFEMTGTTSQKAQHHISEYRHLLRLSSFSITFIEQKEKLN